mmetsp:Transcript_32647/g.56756  ORF Transcript_32647/g.56756 Transcript_32647/m.56756 type:complete len:908 (+) Transcript_32647:2585-5308(+)
MLKVCIRTATISGFIVGVSLFQTTKMGSICKATRKDVVIEAQFDVLYKKQTPKPLVFGRESTQYTVSNMPIRDHRKEVISESSSVTSGDTHPASFSRQMNLHERGLIMTAFAKQFMFSGLSEENIELILDQMKLYEHEVGSIVFEQGHAATNFYIIASGKLEVLVNSQRTAVLQRGQCFGEQALLLNAQRVSTVRALDNVELWGLDRGAFRKAVEASSKANFEENLMFISSVSMFASLTAAQKTTLVEALSSHRYECGQVIVKEGDPGDLFFFIKEGTVAVLQQGVELRRMSKGESFGEQALLYDTLRTATITALSDVKCASIGREMLVQVLGNNLQEIIYQNSVRIALEKSSYLGKLNKHQIDCLIQIAEVRQVPQGEVVIPADLEHGQRVWLILKGSIGGPMTFQKFDIVGECEMFDDMCPMFDTDFVALTDIWVATYTKAQIEKTIDGDFKTVIVYNEAFSAMSRISLLRGLTHTQKKLLIPLIKSMSYRAGQVIFRKGDPSDSLYIVKSGVASVLAEGKAIRYVNENSIFGERGLLEKNPRSVDVFAVTELKCWVLDQTAFYSILDEVARQKLILQMKLQDHSIGLEELRPLRLLGKGMFGVVLQVSYQGFYYAIKGVNRFKVMKYDIYESLQQERELLLQVEHPFIMKLVKTFKDNDWVYFLTEYVNGSDMFDVIREIGILTEAAAKFYIGCLLSALRYLHERSIIYRDLKPENVIIDNEGYPKLIDFGTAKKINGRTFTLVGTPHYMAPEVITSQGYGIAVDYWSLGVILFELLCGAVPFGEDQEDPYAIYELVLQAKPVFTSSVQGKPCVRELITQMLSKNPAIRAAAVEHLPCHPWFSSIEWNNLEDRMVNAPYLPILKSLGEATTDFTKTVSQAFEEHELASPSRRMRSGPEGWDAAF